jgi:hypothetical protein
MEFVDAVSATGAHASVGSDVEFVSGAANIKHGGVRMVWAAKLLSRGELNAHVTK